MMQRERWLELTGLLDRSDRHGLSALSVAEVKHLCRLYRHVTIDLSRARADGGDPDLVRYLNLLAARAHGKVYASRRVDLKPFLTFLTQGLPRLLRRQWRPILVSAAVFYLTALASFVAVVRNPEAAYSLFDEGMVEYENLRLEKQEGEYRGNFTFSTRESPFFAALIIANNIWVSIRLFAWGALLAVPALLMLIFNGRMLGTLEGMTWNHGFFLDFNALILTHGVLELSAICVAGGGGLLLGWSLIAPGRIPRREALRRAAGDAFGLLAGASVILVFAGLIEAYVTPHFSQTVRWSVAAGTGFLLASYVGLAGRDTRLGSTSV